MAEWKKLGLIAGGGELPAALAEYCKSLNQPYFVARVLPFADEELQSHPGAGHELGEMGARVAAMKEAGCDAVVFAGRIARPQISTFKLDAGGMALAQALVGRKGDDALMRAVVEFHANAGFEVLGAEQVMAPLLAPAGSLTARCPNENEMRDIKHAAKVASAIGVFDIGQAVVVVDGLVLGVEAQEGTDALLERMLALPTAVRGDPLARRGVILKRPKPIQERRIDLPTIGLRTLHGASAAGLSGIAVEAGGALIMGREDLVAAADDAGLYVYGFTAHEV